MKPGLTTRCVRWLFLFSIAIVATQAIAAGQPLLLDAANNDIDAWPWASVLHDPAMRLTPDQARADASDYVLPQKIHGNLGIAQGSVWLRLPFSSATSDRTPWWIDLGFPGIDTVDVYLYETNSAVAVQKVHINNHQLQSERILRTQHHVVPLAIQPGHQYELLLRFESATALLIPLRLMRPEAYGAEESRRHVIQGVISGIWLCLLLYALVQWTILRERMFLDYAVSITGASLFFLAYHGFGSQHLWGYSRWLTPYMWVPAVFTMIAANAMFVHDALRIAQWSRWLALSLRAVCWAAIVVGAGFTLGLIDLRTTGMITTTIGALPMLLGIFAASICARRGDNSARLIFLGWVAVLIGTAMLVLLQHGFLPLDDNIQNAMQYAMTFEMVMWMFVLAIRVRDARVAAEAVQREHFVLEEMAYKDSLTGLLNRGGLRRELENLLPKATLDQPLALYLLDLNGFKSVNDTYGHDAGDEVLRIVGARLKAQLRSIDVVSRLGGDEFVVVAPHDNDKTYVESLAARIVAAFDEPFVVGGKSCRVGVSIGYAEAPKNGTNKSALLKCADRAMYASKQSAAGHQV